MGGSGSSPGNACCCELPIRRKQPKDRVRPLLTDLEADFYATAGEDKSLDQMELLALWTSSSIRRNGKLSEEDSELMKSSIAYVFQDIDLDKDGKISINEFLLFMLGATEDRGPLRTMRARIDQVVDDDFSTLNHIVDKFKRWDKNGDGFTTKEELEKHLEELNEEYGMGNADAQAVGKIKSVIIKEADVNQDGKLDLWETVAHALGRRITPVEIILYDVSKGLADTLGPLLLGEKVGALHSGVLAFGSEFFYAGKLYRSKPVVSEMFGQPMEAPWGQSLEKSVARPDIPVVHIGYTFMTNSEFVLWLKSRSNMYTYDKYDILTHSCNHFSNDACLHLTGKPLPEKIFQLQKTFLSSATVSKLRPFLNKYMVGFADADKKLSEDLFSKDYLPDFYKADSDTMRESILGEGRAVVVSGNFIEGIDGEVVATVCSQNLSDDSVEIRFFDPKSLTVDRLWVPIKAILRDIDSHKSKRLAASQNLGHSGI